MTTAEATAHPDSTHRTLRLGPVSIALFGRGIAVSAVLAVLTLTFVAVSVTSGEIRVPLDRVLATLAGDGTPREELIVMTWRLPRALVAVGVGAALGLAGAITQVIARNGLASPDVLGISDGAALGGVLALTIAAGAGAASVLFVPAAALVGGVLTGIAVFALGRWGQLDALRLVLIGIGLGAMLNGVMVYVMVTQQIETVGLLKLWLVGSLNGRGWTHLWWVLIALAVGLGIVARLGFDLRTYSLGRDVAEALGVRGRLLSTALLLTACGLTAVVVAAAGPIGFVALIAPHLARLLTSAPTPPLGTAMWSGACLLVGADLVGMYVLPVELPVGLVTSAVGGPALVLLLVRARRKASV